jgi:RNA polymerase sigma-70 factor (ECF subfamily)
MTVDEATGLHPIDRTDEARRLANAVLSTDRPERDRLLDQLACLAQVAPPLVDEHGRTEKVATYPEIASIFLQVVQAEQLVESSLLGHRYQLRGPENEPARREIAQRTFAAIPDALRAYRGDASIKSYVLGIVANQYRNWVRETARSRSLADLPEDDQLAGATLRSSLLLNKMEIGRAMVDLAPKHRQMIELAFFEGLSASDIQAKLGLTSGQYRNRRRQALKEMAELLEERGHVA